MPNLNLMNHAWFVHHDSFWNMAPTCWTISPNHVLSHMEDLLSLSNLLQPHPIFSCARREKSPFELEDEALGSGLQQFYLFIILINCQELLRRVQSPEQAIPMSIFFGLIFDSLVTCFHSPRSFEIHKIPMATRKSRPGWLPVCWSQAGNRKKSAPKPAGIWFRLWQDDRSRSASQGPRTWNWNRNFTSFGALTV